MFQVSIHSEKSESPYALAIDIGSSSVRSMIFDRFGQEIEGSAIQVEYDLDSASDGELTIDPERVKKLAESCIDSTLDSTAVADLRISVVGTSCFWHSLLGLDTEGNPATPVYHLADTRSSSQVAKLRAEHDEQLWRTRTGTVFHSSYWPAKLLWLSEELPATLSDVDCWISAADYLSSCWLGEIWTSLCMASGTGMCDLPSGTWRKDLAETIGIEADRLPPIVDLDHGRILVPNYAQRWPQLADAVWYPALGDGACANVGCGAVDSGNIALTVGTTAAMRMLQRSPLGDEVEMHDALWAYRLDRNTLVYGAAITNAGLWIDWIRDLFEDQHLMDSAFGLEPAQHSLTVLPFLAGERFPIWNDDAHAVMAGLNPDTTPAEIARAALESLALRLAIMHEKIGPIAADDHRMIANGAAILKSDGLRQVISDAMSASIVSLPSDLEASARGAAILAFRSAGIVDSIQDVSNPAFGAPETLPDLSLASVYQGERERHEALRTLLYTETDSWDRGIHQ